MANQTWFIICGVAFTSMVVVDNVRLRMTLADVQRDAKAKRPDPGDTEPAPRSTTANRSRKPWPIADVAVQEAVATASTLEVEDQIASEVEARVEQAVEARLDTELEDLVDERVEARMEERHQERRDRFQQAMEDRVSEFVAERELSTEAETQMMTVMSTAMDNLGAMFRSMQEGEIEREEMREEMQTIRLDVDEALTEILGEEDADAFQADLRGPLGRRGWSR